MRNLHVCVVPNGEDVIVRRDTHQSSSVLIPDILQGVIKIIKSTVFIYPSSVLRENQNNDTYPPRADKKLNAIY
ncbi:MAG: hypothetical protein AAB362_00375 [Patescibacteria group bacterium]